MDVEKLWMDSDISLYCGNCNSPLTNIITSDKAAIECEQCRICTPWFPKWLYAAKYYTEQVPWTNKIEIKASEDEVLKYIDTIVHFQGFDDIIFYNELAAKVANEYGKANEVLCDEYENVDKDLYVIKVISCSLGDKTKNINRYFIYDHSKRANSKYGKYAEISEAYFQSLYDIYIKE